MCQKNYPHKNEGSLGCVRETLSIKMKAAQDASVKLPAQKEITLQRIAGRFASPPFPNLHISPLGVVPKKQHGSYRLIHHLSHPTGSSINDNIPQKLCTVQYQTIESATAHIRALGQGCFMAKTDIAEAFRIIPILPAQYQLFGLCWRGQYHYDKCCSSNCQIFERLSSALQWIATHKLDIQYISHVLDDFVILNNAHDRFLSVLVQHYNG